MQLFFVLAALVAIVTSQCSVEGNTYKSGSHWITFGTGVDDFIPAVMGDTSAYFTTWKRAQNQNVGSSLWEVREIGATGEWMCGSARPAGVYDVTFSTNCNTVTFTLNSDFLCETRQAFFNTEFTMTQFSECGMPGNEITGRYSESDSSMVLSNQAVDLTYGPNGYVISSVSSHTAIFQHWTMLGTDVSVMDYMSYPEGFACDMEQVGNYELNWETADCGLQACGISDSCLERAQLMHNAGFNSFSGGACPNDFADAHQPDVFGGCSDGTQWTGPASSCVAQSYSVGGGCAFCGGRVEGKDIHICVARNGFDCNTLREQVGVAMYCNLDFECSHASAITMSVVLVAACLFGLLF